MHSVEGGPWDSGDRPLSESAKQALDRKYGLDLPVWRQYLRFLGNAVQGDLGISFQRQDQPVTKILARGFKVTATLGVLALSLAVIAGVSLGVFAALNRNSVPDYVSVLLASVGSSVPNFVLGIFLIYVLSVQLHWLPTFGWNVNRGLIHGVLPYWKQAIMPVITLAALPSAILARVTRASMLEILGQDYIRTARSKGLRWSVILWRHSFRNALIPILTILGPISAQLVTGSFIVEQLFSVPGIGRQFIQSVLARDYGMIMGTTLFYSAIIVVANLMVDITYAFADPRIRYR